MYDDTTYNPQTHVLEFADVGLMSMYIADCDALAKMADVLGKAGDARELRERSAKYRDKLATLWSAGQGDLSQQGSAYRAVQHAAFADEFLSAAGECRYAGTGEGDGGEASDESDKEFWGEWVIPAIARDDHGFQGSELLARADLGSDELPGLSWAEQL